jgi:hypothetical protein
MSFADDRYRFSMDRRYEGLRRSARARVNAQLTWQAQLAGDPTTAAALRLEATQDPRPSRSATVSKLRPRRRLPK